MSLPGRLLSLDVGVDVGVRVFVHTRPSAAACAGPVAPVLLLHAELLSHFSLAALCEPLLRLRPLVLLDLPGHGESDRPSPDRFPYDLPSLAGAVVAVLDALGVARVTILGHALGAAAALAVALRHPQRVERLVLFDLPDGATATPLQRLARVPMLGPLLLRHGFTRRALRRYLTRHLYQDSTALTADAMDRERVSAAVVDYYWERLCRAGGLDAMNACLHTLAMLAPAPDLARVSVPVLRLSGAPQISPALTDFLAGGG